MPGRLLLISYDFAPLGSGGCRRVTQVVSRLAEFGWEVTVLSARWDEGRHAAWDPVLLDSIPSSVRILRPWNLDNWRRRGQAAQKKTEPLTPLKQGGLKKRLAGWARTLWIALNIPDPAMTWRPLAFWAGLREIHTRRPDVILATSPAQSNLLVGRTLSWLTDIPLVTEFRDAWTVEPVRNRLKGINYWPRSAHERAMERSVVKRSQYVISMTEGLTADFQQRYGKLHANRFVTIPNGYVRGELETAQGSADRRPADGVFHIVYTGKLSDRRTPRAFFQALAAFLEQYPAQRGKLCLDIVGLCYPFDDGSTIEQQLTEYSLQDVVRLHGFVSRAESLIWQASADLLLLVVGRVPAETAWVYGLAAKAFDYTVIGRPVFCVAEQGPTARYIKDSGIGEVYGHADLDGMSRALERAISGGFHYAPQDQVISAYEFGALMQRLHLLLEGIVERTPLK